MSTESCKSKRIKIVYRYTVSQPVSFKGIITGLKSLLQVSPLDIFLFLDILKPMKLFKRYWMKKVIRGMGFSFL